MDKKYHNTKPIKVGNDEQNRINRIYLDVARGCSRSCRFCVNGYLYKPIVETSVEKLLNVAEESRKNSRINTVLLTADAIADYSRFNELIKKNIGVLDLNTKALKHFCEENLIDINSLFEN